MTISWEDPELDMTTNVVGTFNVLETARKEKFQSSTLAPFTYTEIQSMIHLLKAKRLYERNPVEIPETQPVMVGKNFSLHVSKMSAEHYVQTYRDMYGISAATFRFTGIYGERQFGKIMVG